MWIDFPQLCPRAVLGWEDAVPAVTVGMLQMDQHELGMLSVTLSDAVGPDPFPVCQAGTLQPWKSSAAIPVASIHAGPGSTSGIPAEEPQRGHCWQEDAVTPRRGPQGLSDSWWEAFPTAKGCSCLSQI